MVTTTAPQPVRKYLFFKGLLVELVGIEPPQWIENIQVADSTMFSNGLKGTNSNSAVQNGTRQRKKGAQQQLKDFARAMTSTAVTDVMKCSRPEYRLRRRAAGGLEIEDLGELPPTRRGHKLLRGVTPVSRPMRHGRGRLVPQSRPIRDSGKLCSWRSDRPASENSPNGHESAFLRVQSVFCSCLR